MALLPRFLPLIVCGVLLNGAGSAGGDESISAKISEPALVEYLEKLYPTSQVDDILECLPVLERYFENEAINTPREALKAHLEQMNQEEKAGYEARLRSIFVYAEMIRMIGNGLPNGYHDLTFALPLSRTLYEPTLATYGLDLEATATDVASSLSTYDNTKIRVHAAILISELDHDTRMAYLERLISKAAQLRHPPSAE